MDANSYTVGSSYQSSSTFHDSYRVQSFTKTYIRRARHSIYSTKKL